MPIDTLALRRLLQQVATVARRLGLGRLVDSTNKRGWRFESFVTVVDGLVVTGAGSEQREYARDVKGGRESFLVELLVGGIRPGDTVVDAGAYIGYVTLQAARAVGNSGRVYAFEPNPELAARIRANVSRNGFQDRVVVFERALGSVSAQGTFYVRGAAEMSSLAPGRGGNPVPVQIARGDDVIDADSRLSVIKIDVEGAEAAVIEGLDATLASAPDVTLLLECNEAALSESGSSPAELLEALVARGFTVRAVDEERRVLVPFSTASPSERWINLYCRREDRVPGSTTAEK